LTATAGAKTSGKGASSSKLSAVARVRYSINASDDVIDFGISLACYQVGVGDSLLFFVMEMAVEQKTINKTQTVVDEAHERNTAHSSRSPCNSKGDKEETPARHGKHINK
jgi:hypothetical protein